MKGFLTALAVAATLLSAANDREIDVQSTVTDVIIYQQGAQVERQARKTIPAGTSVLRFTDLNPGLDPSQIRFSAKGEFNILAMYYDYNTDTISGLGSQDSYNRLYAERAEIQHQINLENSFLDIFNKEMNMLMANQQFGSKEDGVKVTDLIDASNFLRERFTDIRRQQIQIEETVRELQDEMNRIDAKIAMLPPLQTKTTLEYLVRIQAPKQTSARLSLTYQVQAAGWYPSYDAKVESVSEPMALEYKANVYQNTGEDWENVSLTVQTGNPRSNRKKPNLLPWYVSGNPMHYRNKGSNANYYLQQQAWNPDVRSVSGQVMNQDGEPLIGVTITVSGTSTGAVTDLNGYFNIEVPDNGRVLNYSYVGHTAVSLNISSPVMNVVLNDQSTAVLEQVYLTDGIQTLSAISQSIITEDDAEFDSRRKDFMATPGSTDAYFTPPPVANFATVTVSQTPTQTKFSIEEAYDIPSDGRQYAVTIQDLEIDAEYLYAVAPKLDATAYLTARVTDWEEFNLLTGAMNIYFEDAYVGQSQLDMTQFEDTLSISLGEDPNIIVERKRINAKSSKSFIGSKRKEIREFEFTVRNAKKDKIRILVEDQLPLTHNEEIEIERLTMDGASEDEFTGKVTWDLEIGPGKRKTFNLKYALRYPKDMLLALGR